MPLPSLGYTDVVSFPTGKLAGRSTAATGALEALTVGSGLSLSAGTLSNSQTFGGLSPLTTKGDILGFTTVNARVPIGSDAQVLTADSTQSLGLKWATPSTGILTSDSPTLTGAWLWSKNGAVSLPTLSVTGSAFTGGSATTTKPLFLIEPTGTSSTAWPTTGCYVGINGVAGFAGNLIDAQIAHVSQFAVNSNAGVYSTAVCGKMDGSAQYIALGVANELEFWPATAYRVRMTDTTHALGASMIHGWSSNDNPRSANLDTAFSRISAGLIGVGTGAAASVAGSLSLTSITFADAGNLIFGTSTGTKIGTGTTQKIGFWNAAPIVQPATGGAASTFAANTSGTLNDSATWDSYTIGQVVKALRNLGILA